MVNCKFLILACVACSLTAQAATRSDAEMEAIALSKLKTAYLAKTTAGSVTAALHPKKAVEADAYAIYANDGGGFVIVGRDDRLPEVLGYSDSHFDADDMPCCMKWWLNGINEVAASPSAMRRIQARRTKSYTPVAPFITTKWGQGDPFNKKTPKIKDKNAPVGCVATAMAQCMNYCQWPASAKFDSYYYLGNSDDSHEVSVNSRYTWPYLEGYGYYFLDGYTDSNDYQYVDAGRQANLVAQLCVDCGYATHMQYDTDGSATMNLYSGVALIEYFGYPEESVKYINSDYSNGDDEEWMGIINDEMQRKSPIIYGGHDESFGGHAFVLAGLDAEGKVYVEWGWNGRQDGYYDIALLNPEGYKFQHSHDMTYGIRPHALPTDKKATRLHSMSGNPYTFSVENENDDAGKAHIALNISFDRGMLNFSTTTMVGELGLFGTDLTTGQYWQIAETDSDTWEPLNGYILDAPAPLYYYYLENNMVAGHDYRISFGSRDMTENVWHSILCDGGEIFYDIHYTGKAATTTIGEVGYGSSLPTRIEGIAADGINAKGGKSVTRVFTADGRLVHTAPTSNFNLWDVPARGILIVDDGRTRRKVVR